LTFSVIMGVPSLARFDHRNAIGRAATDGDEDYSMIGPAAGRTVTVVGPGAST